MNINIKRKQILIGLSLLVCAYLAFDLSRDGRPEVQKAFDERVKDRLRQPGDTALVSELNPGDWMEVCWLDDSIRVEDFLSYKFHTRPDQLKFASDTYDPYQWTARFIFYYPPNKVEILAAPKPYRVGMTGDQCAGHADAKFTVVHRDVSFGGRDLSANVLQLQK